MAWHNSVMLGWSWTDLSVFGSQFFGQASAETCEDRSHVRLILTKTRRDSHIVCRPSPLLTPSVFTVGWFSKTGINVLVVQSIFPVQQNRRNFWTNDTFLAAQSSSWSLFVCMSVGRKTFVKTFVTFRVSNGNLNLPKTFLPTYLSIWQ